MDAPSILEAFHARSGIRRQTVLERRAEGVDRYERSKRQRGIPGSKVVGSDLVLRSTISHNVRRKRRGTHDGAGAVDLVVAV